MDLKIRDISDLLNVSETTIRGWIDKGLIPAYKLNRQYRFSRIEIENWMMNQKPEGLQDQSEPFPHGEVQIYPEKQEATSQPSIQQYSFYRAINRGGVYHNIQGNTKEEVIRNGMEQIANTMRLDPAVLSELLIDRERLTPTAIDNAIAIPHARESIQHVLFDLVTVVFLESPIEYGALDEKPVDTLFFLFATTDKIHLHLLSKIAHFSSNDKALELLKTRPDKAKLLEFIRDWEGSLRLGNVV